MTLDEHIAEGDNDSHFGDGIILPKPDEFVRAMAVQCNGWLAFANMEKSKKTVKAVKDFEVDMVGFGEVGLNLPNLKDEDSIHARIQHVLHTPKATLASNQPHQPTSPYPYGGVGIIKTFKATTW
jgi:hypothetical protein